MNATPQKNGHLPGITVDPNMKDLNNDPFVLRSLEQARAFIAEHGLPKDFVKRQQEREQKKEKGK